ncbi:MAG: agarase [Hymenobacter sp.]|nr:MAG: agarase [Hymenobacter sp.]
MVKNRPALPLFERGGWGGRLPRLLALALALLTTAAHAQNPADTTEYTLRVAARKVLNNSKTDGTATFTAYKNYPTRTVAQLKGFAPGPTRLSKYGGRLDQRTTATGFFHVRQLNGRWWAVDPEGYYYLHNALNDLQPGNSERNQKALKAKFGDRAGWMTGTRKLLFDNGFNGAGAWSATKDIRENKDQDKQPLAYTINLDWMSGYGSQRGGTYAQPGHKGYPNDVVFVFDPGFEAFCEAHAKQLSEYKNDKNLFGYFSDNELPLLRKNLDGYLKLPATEPGYVAAKKWADERGITLETITDQSRQDFLAYAAERYFSIVAKALKKYDPNHMYLGCRFHGAQPYYPELMRVAGKYLDAVSINYYNKWTPEKKWMADWATITGKPFIVTEWYVKGADAPGLANTAGAGWVVKTQADRGNFYQNFTLGLLESKNCVGWHWFKYQDNDPTKIGAEPSNTDANKGIVDNTFQPYQPLLDKMQELNQQMYRLADYFDKR